jgi:hypothetical protein
MFLSHRTIIRQLNIGIRLVIELLVWIHASATRHVYKVTFVVFDDLNPKFIQGVSRL